MKKRQMKKYIPKGTEYCYKTGLCKNIVFMGKREIVGLDNEEPFKETILVQRCRLIGVDNVDNFNCCFVDRCKACGQKLSFERVYLNKHPRHLKQKIKKYGYIDI